MNTEASAHAAVPVTAEAFFEERRRSHDAFTNMALYGSIGVVVLLVLMAIFLV